MELSILIELLWHHLAPKYSSAKTLPTVAHGHPMLLTAGTLAALSRITNATEWSSLPLDQNAFAQTLNVFPTSFPMLRNSSGDEAVVADQALADALANPAPI